MKYSLALAIAFAAVAIGCNSASTTPASPTVTTATPVEYAKVQAVLNEKCIGCHGATNPKEGISLVSYDSVIKGGRKPIVKPGDAAGSELVQVMRGAPGVKKMPPEAPYASEEQIKLVEDWIATGAKS